MQVVGTFKEEERFFSIETDCSNVKAQKFLPILLRFFDPKLGGK